MILAFKRVYVRLFVTSLFFLFHYQSTVFAEYKSSGDKQKITDLLEKYDPGRGELARKSELLSSKFLEPLKEEIDASGTNHFTYLYPVQMKGENFTKLKGKCLSKLSIMAVRGDGLVPIPFQFDEFDETGLVYIDTVRLNKPEGEPGVLDDSDELVFMFRDAGRKKYQPEILALSEGVVLGEIKLETEGHDERYVYLVEGNYERCQSDYVKADLKKGQIETTLIKISYNPQNFLDMSELILKSGTDWGQNIVDNIYVKLSTGLLSENLRFNLDTHKNIKIIPVGVKDGPVRATVLFKGRINYFGMPTPFKTYVNVNFYEQAFKVPSRFTMDSLNTVKYFINFIKRPRIEVAVDMHNLTGGKLSFDNVYSPNSPEKMGVVDNKISGHEIRMRQQRLPGKWIYFDSNKGWNVFFSNEMNIKTGGLFDECLDGLRINFVYEDNLSSVTQYEKYPGAEPRLGVVLEGIPYEAVDMITSVRKMDFSDVKNLGELIYQLDLMGREGKLKEFDVAANNIVDKLKRKGKVKNKEDLIEMFLSDLNQINFNVEGVSRKDINDLIRKALVIELCDDVSNISCGKIINRGIALAEKKGINLGGLRYVVSDSTLWIPDATGPGGPDEFYRQVQSPPVPSFSFIENRNFTIK